MITRARLAFPAGLLIWALLAGPASGGTAPPRPHHQSADDRAVARFTHAVHDYVEFGRTQPLFTLELTEVLRFRLRFTRWLYRYDALETLNDRPTATHGQLAPPASILGALPRLPGEIEYRLHRGHLLLVDRRTRDVIDVLADAVDAQ